MAKNLFEHIKGVTKDKVKWESLPEEDMKSWSNFIISRWFSMEMELVESINYFQKYSNGILTSKDYYKLLFYSLPKTSLFLKYIKKRKIVEMDQKFLDIFCNHYELGRNSIYDYVRILKKTNPDELVEVLKSYGTLKEDIELFLKQLKAVP